MSTREEQRPNLQPCSLARVHLHTTTAKSKKPQMNTANSPWTWSTTQGDGHPALADFLAQDPDHETYVFRKFKRLAVRNVLYLQGELTALEEEVETLEREATKSDDPEVHLSMRSWKTLDENARRPGGEKSLECRLKQLHGSLDGKLKTYCSLSFCPHNWEIFSLIPVCEKMKRLCSSAILRCSRHQAPESLRRCGNGYMVLRGHQTSCRNLTVVTEKHSASGRIWSQ
jgi:hypothetical protein